MLAIGSTLGKHELPLIIHELVHELKRFAFYFEHGLIGLNGFWADGYKTQNLARREVSRLYSRINTTDIVSGKIEFVMKLDIKI